MTQDTSYQVPFKYYPAEGAKAQVIIAPGMGVPARFFTRLAEEFARQGLTAYIIEFRGHGESTMRASRKVDFGYKDHADDLLSICDKARAAESDIPLYIVGHSMGGHIGLVAAAIHRDKFDGLVFAGSGIPYKGHYGSLLGVGLILLAGIVSLLILVLGFFPGNIVGFAAREARSEMRDWRHLILRSKFKVCGMGEDIQKRIARFRGRVLAFQFPDDRLVSMSAIKAALELMPNASHEIIEVNASEIGMKSDHFNWARSPEAVVRKTRLWIEKHTPAT